MTDTLIDYAQPMLRIERQMREIHDFCLRGQYDEANAKTVELVTEGRLLMHALHCMAEQQRARRKEKSDAGKT